MKKGIIIMAITLMGSTVFAQNIGQMGVPQDVMTKFTSLYPGTTADQWKKEKGNYEAKFTKNNEIKCIIIDPMGNLVRATTHINVTELPITINDYVVKNYAGKKITDACRTIEANGTIKYEAEVNAMHLCFDANGTFIKSEKRKT